MRPPCRGSILTFFALLTTHLWARPQWCGFSGESQTVLSNSDYDLTDLALSVTDENVLFAADYNFRVIRKIDMSTSPATLSIAAGTEGVTGESSISLGRPASVDVATNGDLLVADILYSRVVRWSPGAVVGQTVFSLSPLFALHDVSETQTGSLFVSLLKESVLTEYNLGTNTRKDFVAMNLTSTYDGWSVDVDSANNRVWVVTYNNGVFVWNLADGTEITRFVLYTYLDRVQAQKDGQVLVSSSDTIWRFCPGDTITAEVIAGDCYSWEANYVDDPTGIVITADGSLYHTERYNGNIVKRKSCHSLEYIISVIGNVWKVDTTDSRLKEAKCSYGSTPGSSQQCEVKCINPSATLTLECAKSRFLCGPLEDQWRVVSAESCFCPGSWIADGVNSRCDMCGKGTFFDKASSSCAQCPTGTYGDQEGATQCTSCPAGKYGDAAGLSSCKECAKGSYQSLSGATECQLCPAGRYESSKGKTECTQCPTGRYEDSVGSTSCRQCSPGSFQASLGASECQLCPEGFFESSWGSSGCDPCSAGRYSLSGADSCLKCSRGTFQASTGKSACDDCPLGSASSTRGATECPLCEAGSFASTTGLTSCSSCLSGEYQSSEGKSECTSCPLGTFSSLFGATACSQCIKGSFSDSLGALACQDCKKGSFQASEGQSVCTLCPQGSFSDVTGSSACSDCPAGRFSDTEGLALCHACAAGTFSAFQGMTSCQQCEAGLFAGSEGMSACQECRAGSYSLQGGSSSCIDCPTGTFSEVVGAADSSVCQPCAVGFFAPRKGTSACSKCPLGYFGSEEGMSTCSSCPQGSYQDRTGMTDQAACTVCSPGSYASVEGSSSCEPCPAGRFTGGVGTVECDLCPMNSYSPQSGATSCISCEQGHVAVAGSPACSLCLPGTFMRVDRDTCLPCQPGTVSASPASVSCLECAVGTVAEQAGMSMCRSCGIGFYSPSLYQCLQCERGTFGDSREITECSQCPPGTYQQLKGQTRCKACPPGTFNPNSGAAALHLCVACSPGSFSSDPSGATLCTLCPENTATSEEGSTECLPCKEGYHQDNPGSSICEEDAKLMLYIGPALGFLFLVLAVGASLRSKKAKDQTLPQNSTAGNAVPVVALQGFQPLAPPTQTEPFFVVECDPVKKALTKCSEMLRTVRTLHRRLSVDGETPDRRSIVSAEDSVACTSELCGAVIERVEEAGQVLPNVKALADQFEVLHETLKILSQVLILQKAAIKNEEHGRSMWPEFLDSVEWLCQSIPEAIPSSPFPEDLQAYILAHSATAAAAAQVACLHNVCRLCCDRVEACIDAAPIHSTLRLCDREGISLGRKRLPVGKDFLFDADLNGKSCDDVLKLIVDEGGCTMGSSALAIALAQSPPTDARNSASLLLPGIGQQSLCIAKCGSPEVGPYQVVAMKSLDSNQVTQSKGMLRELLLFHRFRRNGGSNHLLSSLGTCKSGSVVQGVFGAPKGGTLEAVLYSRQFQALDSGNDSVTLQAISSEWIEERELTWILCILQGLHFLHRVGVTHGDVRAANILLATANGYSAKLGCFGCSIDPKVREESPALLKYSAPEAIQENSCTPDGLGRCAASVDVYSLGFLLYEIIFRQEVWPGISSEQVLDHLFTNTRPPLPPAIENPANNVESELISLIESCWSAEPNKRPSLPRAFGVVVGVGMTRHDIEGEYGGETSHVFV